MKRLTYINCLLIIIILPVFPVVNLFGAEPLITQVSGPASESNTITATGEGFGEVFTGDFCENFDDYTSQWVCNTSPGCSIPGSWDDYYISSSDQTRIAAIDKNGLEIDRGWDQYYSTGAGFRVGRGYYNKNYGLFNQHLRHNLGSGCTELWVRFYVKWGDSTDGWFPGVHKIDKQAWLRFGTNPGDDNAQGIMEGRTDGTDSSRWIWYLSSQQTFGGTNMYAYTPDSRDNSAWPGPEKWQEIKIYWKHESSIDASDGVLKWWTDGRLAYSNTSINWTNEPESMKFTRFGLGGNMSGCNTLFNPGESNYKYYDDIVLVESDNDPGSISTVYLSNNSTWGAGVTDRWNGDANFIRQKVGGSVAADYGFKSWSDIQFKFEVNLGNIDINKPVYLYVTSWNGETNSSGYHLVEGFPPAAPTGVEVK